MIITKLTHSFSSTHDEAQGRIRRDAKSVSREFSEAKSEDNSLDLIFAVVIGLRSACSKLIFPKLKTLCIINFRSLQDRVLQTSNG